MSVIWQVRVFFLICKYIFEHSTQRLDWSVKEVDKVFTPFDRSVIKHFILLSTNCEDNTKNDELVDSFVMPPKFFQSPLNEIIEH